MSSLELASPCTAWSCRVSYVRPGPAATRSSWNADSGRVAPTRASRRCPAYRTPSRASTLAAQTQNSAKWDKIKFKHFVVLYINCSSQISNRKTSKTIHDSICYSEYWGICTSCSIQTAPKICRLTVNTVQNCFSNSVLKSHTL